MIAALTDHRNAKWIGLGLFVLTLLTRLPFQSQYLYHWDSVNMAFGVRQFDVINEAPQYPGYIVYIVLAQAVNLVVNDPQTTMVLISMVSSGLAAAALFFLGRAMFNPVTGLLAALFLIASPLVWFYGEIALPHTLDLFAVIYAALLLYPIKTGNQRWLWWTAVVLALIGGFRQQTLMFLAPLALFALAAVGIRKLILFTLVGAAVTLLWFVPLMAYSGGLQSYLAGSGAYSARFFDTTSLLAGAGITGLRRNLISKLLPYTAYALSLAALPLLVWISDLRRPRRWLTNTKLWFLLLWMLPALAFYIIIHMGQQGLVFVFLPALLLGSAEGLRRLFEGRPALLWGSAAVIVLVGAGIFIAGPTYPLGEDGPKLLTYSTLREHDAELGAQIAAVRANFAPDNTLLLSSSWRFFQYYLPEYRFARFSVGAKFEVDEGQSTGADYVNQPMTAAALGLSADTAWQVVIMDVALRGFTSASLEAVSSGEYSLSVLPLAADEAYFTDGQTFGGQPASG